VSRNVSRAQPPPEFFTPEEPALSSDAAAPEGLPAGYQLGNYVVQECIGRGAMASVYRAEHSLLKKAVALKVMAPALHASAEARARFLREAQAVAAIAHPHVVSITDVGLADGMPFLVMELLEGEDLEQHLERHGQMPSTELAALALPIVAALAAAHDAGVIHRDLKPGNIFLARGFSQLTPKVLDFGISKLSNSAQPAGLAVTAFDQLLGSPLYLPPEALQGSRELTARSDQYSLGVVLYECATGQAPFFREDLVPLLTAISEGSCAAPRQLRPEIPLPLERAIVRAMSVDPRRRFAHIRDLGRALLEVADVRTRHVWAPVFLEPSVLAATAPATAAAVTTALVTTASGAEPALPAVPSRPGRRASSARRGPLGALCLLVAGVALLVLAVGRMRQDVHLTVQEPALAISRLEAAVPAESAPRLTAVPPESEPALASSPLESTWVAAPAAAATQAAVAEAPAAEAVAPKARKRRAAGDRARGSDTERELRNLFFPDGSEQPSREREGRRAASEPPASANEAPFFD